MYLQLNRKLRYNLVRCPFKSKIEIRLESCLAYFYHVIVWLLLLIQKLHFNLRLLNRLMNELWLPYFIFFFSVRVKQMARIVCFVALTIESVYELNDEIVESDHSYLRALQRWPPLAGCLTVLVTINLEWYMKTETVRVNAITLTLFCCWSACGKN